jgi:predicted HicB family RNase H-like nuclease
MDKKNLDYYMKLPYTIEVIPIPESQGGGYTARLPQIGRFAITGDGETPEEAINSLEIAKRERFAEYLEKGIEIPEPEEEKEEYSGRFIVRLPKILHRMLVADAKENQISLNQYINYLLTSNYHLDRQEKQFETIIGEINTMKNAIWGVTYSYQVQKEIVEPFEDIDLKSAKLKAA